MTTEFKIDRPGVYRRRDGVEVCLWPTLCTTDWRWMQVGNDCPMIYLSAGNYLTRLRGDCGVDIVAYVSPLPADILQRMREALALAEVPQRPTVEQREKYACDVCGNTPDDNGFIEHGRGCYVVNEDGGGITLVEFEEDPKQ